MLSLLLLIRGYKYSWQDFQLSVSGAGDLQVVSIAALFKQEKLFTKPKRRTFNRGSVRCGTNWKSPFSIPAREDALLTRPVLGGFEG